LQRSQTFLRLGSRFRQHTSCNTWQFKNKKRFILVLATLALVFFGMGQRRIIGHSDFGVLRLSLSMSLTTVAGLRLPVYMISDVFDYQLIEVIISKQF
tara:strand:- start:37 stop:330 length:294 start_codon:yes stop_codon:yes gene_type:complete